MPPEAAAPPLSAIRVLDLTTARCEIAGRILADLGAEVLKIEPPEGGDSRRMPPFEDGREGDPDGSLYWAVYGRGKRSVVLDLASAEGQAPTAGARRGRGHPAGVVRAGAPGRPRAGLQGSAPAQPGAGLRLDQPLRAERPGRALAGDGADDRGGGRPALADRATATARPCRSATRRPGCTAGRRPRRMSSSRSASETDRASGSTSMSRCRPAWSGRRWTPTASRPTRAATSPASATTAPRPRLSACRASNCGT